MKTSKPPRLAQGEVSVHVTGKRGTPYSSEKETKAAPKIDSLAGSTGMSRPKRNAVEKLSLNQDLSTDHLRTSFFSSRGLSIADAQKSWKKNLPFFYIKNFEGKFLPCEKVGKKLLHHGDLVEAAFKPDCVLLAAIDRPFSQDIHIGTHDDLVTGQLPKPVVLYTLTQSFHSKQDTDCLRVFVLEMKDKISPQSSDREFREKIFKGISVYRQLAAADKCVCHCAAITSKPFLQKLLERWRNPEAMIHDDGGDYFFALTYAAQRLQFAEAKLLLEFGARADFTVFDKERYLTPMARMTSLHDDPGYKEMTALLARSLKLHNSAP